LSDFEAHAPIAIAVLSKCDFSCNYAVVYKISLTQLVARISVIVSCDKFPVYSYHMDFKTKHCVEKERSFRQKALLRFLFCPLHCAI